MRSIVERARPGFPRMLRAVPARLPFALVLLLLPAQGIPAAPSSAAPRSTAAPATRDETADLASLRSDAVAAYGKEDYARAESLAARYIERARLEGRVGREFAAVSFVLGHARYELHKLSGGPYRGDYHADVVAPLEESLRVLQDDPAFKNMLLANAYFELWSMTGRRDADAEAHAQWHHLKSIMLREIEVRERPRTSPEYDLFARHLLFYLERCLELARLSASSETYLYRIRSLAPRGFASAYDDRFRQVYELTFFDGGNMKAAAFWQRGLDGMQDPKAEVDGVLAHFRQAASLTRHRTDQAEVYRQMADYISTLDDPERRVQAADFSGKAYGLDPASPEIRRQFGSALHILSYAAYVTGQFAEALRYAEEAATFPWEGMEVAFFDLSRSAAELGNETDALTHGERAYRMAKERIKGEALQPFAQNYVNILRQFGQDALAGQVRREAASSGVR